LIFPYQRFRRPCPRERLQINC